MSTPTLDGSPSKGKLTILCPIAQPRTEGKFLHPRPFVDHQYDKMTGQSLK
jgi:hypothetical protein